MGIEGSVGRAATAVAAAPSPPTPMARDVLLQHLQEQQQVASACSSSDAIPFPVALVIPSQCLFNHSFATSLCLKIPRSSYFLLFFKKILLIYFKAVLCIISLSLITHA